MSHLAFLCALAVPFVCVWLSRPRSPVWRWLMAVFVCYVLLLAAAEFRRSEKQRRIDAYDLDRNGFIDGREITREADSAVLDASSDTGLILAPITTGIAAPLWSLLAFVVVAHVRARRPPRESARVG